MIVQIYEVQDADEARKLCDLGVDHIGVLVGNGDFPREIPIEIARGVFEGVVAPAKKVALSLSSDLLFIEKIVRGLRPDILHLGSLLSDFNVPKMMELKRTLPQLPLMRSIPVIDQESVDAAEKFAAVSDFLLLDTYQKADQQIGATGVIHDWTISRRIVGRINVPVILAGGLGADNVCEAIRAVKPAGVDSKTRTDHEGSHRKDLAKVRAFVRSAKGMK
jgi:phosphoribosylanthranilate isomerase